MYENQPMNVLLKPSDVSRGILYQAVANRKLNDSVTPEFFISNYIKFVSMIIANGSPSNDTIESYKKNIDFFLNWCMGQARVSPFTLKEKHIQLYRRMLFDRRDENGKPYSSNTIANRIVAVKAFYQAALKQGIVKENPCEDVKVSKEPFDTLPFAYYTMDEIKEMVTFTKENFMEFECYRNLAIIYLMAVAGLRCVEVHRANQEDINWNDFTMVVHGKGHDGVVYLDSNTATVLQEYLDVLARQEFTPVKEGMNTPLIVSNATNRMGYRLARNSIRWNINRVLEGSGKKQKGQTCHVLRHSCATALYKNTHDLRVVQDTLRHRSPAITSRYAHVVEQLQHRPTSSLGDLLSE